MAQYEPDGGRARIFLQPSLRADGIRPFIVMEVLERAFELERCGRSVIHMEVGEPDFETPEVIREAGIRAIRDGHTHYTHSLGNPVLRDAIAGWQFEQYGIDVSPDQIVVTLGCSGAMILTFAVLLDPAQRVLMTDPGYPCYPKFVQAFGGEPLAIPVQEKDGFHFQASQLERFLDPRVRALLINSPSNPTGTLLGSSQLADLAEAVRGKAVIVSDEIYHGLVYGEPAHSILEYTADAVVINGFSKLFAMTGWRLGYAIFPRTMIRAVQRLQQNLFISAADFTQIAGVAALREAGDEVEAMRREYDLRRKFVLAALEKMGFKIAVEPRGAFYIFVNVSAYTDNVYEFAFQVLEEAGVAVTPGIDFGGHGEGFIRLCYANSMEKLEEGMSRLGRFFDGLERK